MTDLKNVPATPSAASVGTRGSAAALQNGVCCGGPGSDENYFPNATVLTHDGKRALFYNDLLRGRLVLVNFMSVRNDGVYPVSENLARVQQLLGNRSGRDVFMYSITDDPGHDTPEVLNKFAQKLGVKPGWKFLSGDAKTLELIKGRFHVRRGGGEQHSDSSGHSHSSEHSHHDGHGANHDCSMGLVRYGNVATGLWGSVAAKADPKLIVERIDWVTPRPVAVGDPKRGGPPPLARRKQPATAKSPAEQDS